MAIITIDSGTFCQGNEIAQAVARRLGTDPSEDDAIFSIATERSGVPAAKLARSVRGATGLLASAPRNRDLHVAHIRLALAGMLERDGWVHHGLCGHLAPSTVTHVLKVCIASAQARRVERAMEGGLSAKKAKSLVQEDDGIRSEWTRYLFDRGPWDESLFDVVIPIDEMSIESAVDIVCENAAKQQVAVSKASLEAAQDFRLACEVQLALAAEGHDVDVSSRAGEVTILLKKHTLFVERLQGQLEAIARKTPGVTGATAKPGPRYREPNIYVNLDAELSGKVLLVDDEREFVHTLSERLKTRDISAAIAYDGEEALQKVASDEPEVMVLDLKMPGIDGLEVLRRVKKDHPTTEVIILTGHGSDAEETLALQLGAFAYLRKPVDISVLTETMQAAYRRVGEGRTGRGTE